LAEVLNPVLRMMTPYVSRFQECIIHIHLHDDSVIHIYICNIYIEMILLYIYVYNVISSQLIKRGMVLRIIAPKLDCIPICHCHGDASENPQPLLKVHMKETRYAAGRGRGSYFTRGCRGRSQMSWGVLCFFPVKMAMFEWIGWKIYKKPWFIL
jgi:hypothetical protein